jgi:hypothetical protein
MAMDDQEFLDFFADQYWPLRRVGFLLTGDWHEADELAQEAMARTYAAWAGCGSASGRRPMRARCCSIATARWRAGRGSSAASGARSIAYAIDWGRYCLEADKDCGSHSIHATIQASDQALLDRYGPVAERIVGTLAPMRPSEASTGDRTRPACRQDQWRPALSSRSKLAADSPRWVIAGDIRYLQGPACHLRTTLRLTVERADGTPVAVPGTSSALTVEADLPEDGGMSRDFLRTPTMWVWGWDNWCKQPLPQARVRVTTDSGASTTWPLPPRSIQDPRFPCHPNAPWRIVPLT